MCTVYTVHHASCAQSIQFTTHHVHSLYSSPRIMCTVYTVHHASCASCTCIYSSQHIMYMYIQSITVSGHIFTMHDVCVYSTYSERAYMYFHHTPVSPRRRRGSRVVQWAAPSPRQADSSSEPAGSQPTHVHLQWGGNLLTLVLLLNNTLRVCRCYNCGQFRIITDPIYNLLYMYVGKLNV